MLTVSSLGKVDRRRSSMSRIIYLGSAVYVRYLDHVLFRNMGNPISVPVDRETLGWLADETSDTIRILWDKTRKSFPNMNDSPHSGLVLIKSCILEMRPLPLQDFLRRPLSCWKDKDTVTEYALPTKRRKIQHQKRTGAKR
jgi:hypothetical protein